MQFAEILKRVKEERKLTNTQIAEFAGVTEGAVRSWLDGSKLPGVASFGLLCDNLDIDANYLLGHTSRQIPVNKKSATPEGEQPATLHEILMYEANKELADLPEGDLERILEMVRAYKRK